MASDNQIALTPDHANQNANSGTTEIVLKSVLEEFGDGNTIVDSFAEFCEELLEKERALKKEGGQNTTPKDGATDDEQKGVVLKAQFTALCHDASKLSKPQYMSCLTAFMHQAEQELQTLISPVPPLPEPDSTGKSYKLFVSRTDPFEHLEKVWGQWLKRYSSELDRDFLFQDELGHRDPALLEALRNRLKYLRRIGDSSENTKDYISPIAARNDAKLAESDPHTLKEATRLVAAAANRKYSHHTN